MIDDDDQKSGFLQHRMHIAGTLRPHSQSVSVPLRYRKTRSASLSLPRSTARNVRKKWIAPYDSSPKSGRLLMLLRGRLVKGKGQLGVPSLLRGLRHGDQLESATIPRKGANHLTHGPITFYYLRNPSRMHGIYSLSVPGVRKYYTTNRHRGP